MEAVHQLQLNTQVLLSQVVQHPGRGGIIKWSMDETKDYLRCSLIIISAPGVHEALHEGGPVLGQAEAGQPLVPDPLVVHVPVGEGGPGGGSCDSLYDSLVTAYLEVAGAEGEVSDTISWMASRSLSRCSGLLIPISR